MIKKYNVFLVSRLYLKDYYKFLVEETDIRKSSDAFLLFMYSIKKVYNLDTVEYCEAIEKYGEKCIKRLQNTPNTPTERNKMSWEDRSRIVSVCEGYAHATNILVNKNISNSRLKEG